MFVGHETRRESFKGEEEILREVYSCFLDMKPAGKFRIQGNKDSRKLTNALSNKSDSFPVTALINLTEVFCKPNQGTMGKKVF